jgi:cell division protein FtsB
MKTAYHELSHELLVEEALSLRDEIKRLRAENAQLRDENAELRREIADLNEADQAAPVGSRRWTGWRL